MRVIDLTSVLNDDRRVQIYRCGAGYLVEEYDSIRSVELRFADEEVSLIDFNINTGDYEIYIC